MMRRRMVGRRVTRAVVGTAVVVGTAGAVSHHQQKKYAQQDAAAQQQTMDEQQAEQPAPPPEEQYAAPVEQAPEAPGSDMPAQFQQLAQLHESGVLTDEEFAAAKQKLLAS
jgi:hypothetical protein